MNTAEAVQEIIDAELSPEELQHRAMSEIAQMVTLNQVLNAALWKQTTLVAELQERIRNMEKIAALMVDDAAERQQAIIETLTQGGSHAEKNVDLIAAIRLLVKLQRMLVYDRAKINSAAAGGHPVPAELDDIPF